MDNNFNNNVQQKSNSLLKKKYLTKGQEICLIQNEIAFDDVLFSVQNLKIRI